MKANPKKLMHLIGGGGTIRIGQPNIPAGHPAANIEGCYHESHKAECLPMTEEAYADYHARHGGKLIYPSLEAYPSPRG